MTAIDASGAGVGVRLVVRHSARSILEAGWSFSIRPTQVKGNALKTVRVGGEICGAHVTAILTQPIPDRRIEIRIAADWISRALYDACLRGRSNGENSQQ
jgi:hypothetical protein